MLYLKKTDKRLSDIKSINDISEKNKTSVYMLGGGVYARALSRYLISNGLIAEIVYVIDDDYYEPSHSLTDDTILFSTYLEKYAEFAPLIFAIYNFELIQKKKKKYSEKIKYMFDFHITVIGNRIVDWQKEFVEKNIVLFQETFDMWADDKSRETMQYYIDAAVGGEFEPLFGKCKESPMYFGGCLRNSYIDKLFDCGAYDGDTIHDYINVYDDYDEIYAFEPDKANVKKIGRRLENEKIRNLTIVEKGVWSETTVLHFSSDGTSSSCVSDEGNETVEVIKLDELYDRFTGSSLIKMDIEGSELEALKGAAKVIKEIHPALAVCVYHKQEDLITIPQYISGLVDKGTYHYYLGYQGLDLAELVFYAVPNNKMNS